MKFDKRNPRHWLALAGSALVVVATIALRPLWPRRRRPLVVFYGHRLNGNLAAVHRELLAAGESGPEAMVLTMDAEQARELGSAGVSVVRADRPAAVGVLASAAAVVSDHGLHAMTPLVWLSNLKFFDVWHGIPFKGFDKNDFWVQRRYCEVWVSSSTLRAMYIERFGFRPDRVVATGYARTDRLVRNEASAAEHRERLGLNPARRLILFAPTWKQDSEGRSIFPFGLDAQAFLNGLALHAKLNGADIGLRTHLNTRLQTRDCSSEGIVCLASADWPDTEAVLMASDILICDWSSIAFDFLILNRPCIFLDVPAPFEKGFSLGPEHRYGDVVGSFAELQERLAKLLKQNSDETQCSEQASAHREYVAKVVYGEFNDGRAGSRCVHRLTSALR